MPAVCIRLHPSVGGTDFESETNKNEFDMAKQTDGILGGFNGKVGTVVGYRWKGIWCVRSHNALARNPRTEAQQAHRAMFKAEVQLAGKMRWAVNVGLKLPADEMNMTAQNLFVKGNQHAFSSVEGFFKVDYAALQVSYGPVAPVAFGEVRVVDYRTLVVDFEKNPLHRVASSEDKVYLAAFCPDLNSFALSQPARRGTKSVEMSFLSAYSGKGVHLWGFVVDRAGRASLSEYIGYGYLDPTAAENEEDAGTFACENAGDGVLADAGTVQDGGKPSASAGRMPAHRSDNPPDI